MFWNYLAKYSCFKTWFSKNQVIRNQTKKKKLWNSSSMWIFPNNSIFIKSSFTLKLDFLKIKIKNRSILLDSFRIEIFCYIFWKKRQMSILAQTFSSPFYLVSFLGSRCMDSVWVNMGISFQLTPPTS